MYQQRPPQPLLYLFAFEVTEQTQRNGCLTAALASLKAYLHSLPEGWPNRVGIVTYDSQIQVWKLGGSRQPHMMVLGSVEDPFDALNAASLFVSPVAARTNLDFLLDNIPRLFANSKQTANCFGSVLKLAAHTFEETGGKLLAFQASLPSAGLGICQARLDKSAIGTTNEPNLYKIQNKYYGDITEQCVKSRVAVDLFLFPTDYIDIATIATPTSRTGGQVYFYPGFNPLIHAEKFHAELMRNLTRETGYEGTTFFSLL